MIELLLNERVMRIERDGRTKEILVPVFHVTLNGQMIYELPGNHIPLEFIENRSWAEDNNLELLLSQFASTIQQKAAVQVQFELNSFNRFRSKSGLIRKPYGWIMV
jgi:hypothetical protein